MEIGCIFLEKQETDYGLEDGPADDTFYCKRNGIREVLPSIQCRKCREGIRKPSEEMG